MIKKINLLLVLVLLTIVNSGLSANEKNCSEKKALLVFGQKESGKKFSVKEEVHSLLVDAADDLGRFKIFEEKGLGDKFYEEMLNDFENTKKDSIKKYIEAEIETALITNVLNFSQKGVPTEEDLEEEKDNSLLEDVFEFIFVDDDEKYSHNIQTQISIQVLQLNLSSRQVENSFKISKSHTGGTKGKSRDVVMKDLKRHLRTKLRESFLLKSAIETVKETNVTFNLGKNIGVKKNTIFEILDDNKDFPNRIGFVYTTDVGADKSKSEILRKWERIKPTYSLVEYPKGISALTFYSENGIDNEFLSIGLALDANPLRKINFGGSVEYSNNKDSSGRKNNGFGMGLLFNYKFYKNNNWALNFDTAADLDIFFRKDDENNSVSTAIISAPLGISGQIFLTKKTDLVLNLGYRFSSSTDKWSYYSDEEKISAKWFEEKPKVENSGFFIKVGMKFYIF